MNKLSTRIEQNKKYNQLWQDMKICTTTYSKKSKVAFKYKKAKYKTFRTLTLIVFTNTFNYSPIQTL